jgi:hypothetical protein
MNMILPPRGVVFWFASRRVACRLAQLVAVTIRVIWFFGFSVEVVLLSHLVQEAGEAV